MGEREIQYLDKKKKLKRKKSEAFPYWNLFILLFNEKRAEAYKQSASVFISFLFVFQRNASNAVPYVTDLTKKLINKNLCLLNVGVTLTETTALAILDFPT